MVLCHVGVPACRSERVSADILQVTHLEFPRKALHGVLLVPVSCRVIRCPCRSQLTHDFFHSGIVFWTWGAWLCINMLVAGAPYWAVSSTSKLKLEAVAHSFLETDYPRRLHHIVCYPHGILRSL